MDAFRWNVVGLQSILNVSHKRRRTTKEIMRFRYSHEGSNQMEIDLARAIIIGADLIFGEWSAVRDMQIDNGLGRHPPHVAEAGEGLQLSIFTV